SEQNKESRLHSQFLSDAGGLTHLRDGGSLSHAVEDLLRAGLGSVPDAETSRFAETLKDVVIDEIDPRQAFVWMLCIPRFDFAYEIVSPLFVDRQHVIGNPHDVRLVALFEHEHFVHDILRGTLTMRVAEHLAGAPCAMKGTAAGRNQGNRAFAVVRFPSSE